MFVEKEEASAVDRWPAREQTDRAGLWRDLVFLSSG